MACLNHAVSQYRPGTGIIKLAAAAFNRRAIKVYQKVGSVETNRTTRDTHIGQVDFIDMEKRIVPSSAQSHPLPPLNSNPLQPSHCQIASPVDNVAR
jgi:hypothetical protein